jgi:TolB-like protein/Flp pilus assembly protein TadD
MATSPPVAKLSHYRLLEPLGRGAMGEVWLAEDSQLPRKVAVKLLPRELAADADAVERLLREAKAAASVDHPNVVTVHEAGIAEGRPYVVMQRVEGETLEARLARGPLPVEETIAMVRALADALAEVHALGIVHRDLKPSNIMATARGPKILDFGIAAVGGQERLTSTGLSVGTPLYMSPEQARGLEPDKRSDLWALGVILYRCLTGTLPFDGANLAAIVRAILEDAPPPPSRRDSRVPAALDAIVARLLKKDANDHYARADDLVADLTGIGGATVDVRAIDATATLVGNAPLAEAVEAPRLGVLYFEVLSADPDDAFFAAGLTEDLIVDLARVEGLRVAARGEVQAFKGRDLPVRTIAREIGVDYLVQGSVRRAGQRARISAQLVRARDGHAMWAERFDRTLEDLFDTQAEVSKRIVEALQVRLRPAERAMLEHAPSRNREAYALYLKARALLDENRRDANRNAETLLREAVKLDPEFALAHATLAECLGMRGTSWWSGREVVEQARPHAMRATELDPDLPQAHMAMGIIHRLEGNAEALLREIEAVARPDSTDPVMIRWAGWSYLTQGQPERGVAILERGIRLHPRNYFIGSALVDGYSMLGRHEDERRMLLHVCDIIVEVLERNPGESLARAFLAIALAQVGESQASLAQAERAIQEEPDDARIRYNVACAFSRGGHIERALEQLRVMVQLAPNHLTDWVRRDPDLAAVHGHPEFVRMFGKA